MPRKKILYKLTAYDKEQLELIDKILKTGCPITFLEDFSRRRTCSWFSGSLVCFSYKKWKAYIVAPTKATFIDPLTGKDIDICCIYSDEASLSAAINSGKISCGQNNWLQYWIFDDNDHYISGGMLKNKDILKCIKEEGPSVCARLIEEWNKVPHEERVFRLSQTKWSVPYEL